VQFPATLPVAMNSAALLRFLDNVCESMPNAAEADRKTYDATEADRVIRQAVETARAIRQAGKSATVAGRARKSAHRSKGYRTYISPLLAGLAVLVLAQILWSMLFIEPDSAQPLQVTAAESAPMVTIEQPVPVVATSAAPARVEPVAVNATPPQVERIYLGRSEGVAMIAPGLNPVIESPALAAEKPDVIASPALAAEKPAMVQLVGSKPSKPVTATSSAGRSAGEKRATQTADITRSRTRRPKPQPQAFTSFFPSR
jgi:hypothetical protein